MEHGTTVFEYDFRLICYNLQYRIMLDLPNDIGQFDISIDRIIDYLVARSDTPPMSQMTKLNRLTGFDWP